MIGWLLILIVFCLPLVVVMAIYQAYLKHKYGNDGEPNKAQDYYDWERKANWWEK